ncbi:DUF72 domain-containing protein [Paracraurococcus lichenis]|uniref:DUF72 domain-containing protein n=1 Tax=Paracraurococcus lichenis TaxID=3064888 RepID=A0ABT9EBZ2_9PROT|nr:DUF72 domain-containing protein [Paracraurococcus sp. LOR1-02]MDO9713743.1 DUF72 domain-containing protein [Paracraurococcus sp. LOR1-02]
MIGTAGWAIPAQHADAFPSDGSHLQRYSSVFRAVEINSSFYRPHRPNTYTRWAATVPADFRFAVKMPKEITHTRRLVQVEEPLARFLGEVTSLGPKLGPLLVQLPPSLAFGPVHADFFRALRDRFAGAIACEPRHRSWFTDAVDQLLADLRIARVAADPALVPRAGEPGGWLGLCYHRLHGSPRMYHSAYTREVLDALARRIAGHDGVTWCIFDNTAEGAASHDAMRLAALLPRVDEQGPASPH